MPSTVQLCRPRARRRIAGCTPPAAAARAAQGLKCCDDAEAQFLRAKLQSARFYAEYLLPQSLSLARTIKSGGASIVEADSELI